VSQKRNGGPGRPDLVDGAVTRLMPGSSHVLFPFRLAWRTVNEFVEDDCASMAAALAYYTFFSLPPLLVIIISIAGVVLGEQAARSEIEDQVTGLVGVQVADQIEMMVRHARERASEGRIAALLGAAALVFAATTAFAQLQSALNRIWRVQPDPSKSGVRQFLMKRVLSFGMVVSVAFLLLISLTLSAALGLIGGRINYFLPEGFSNVVLELVEAGTSFFVIALLFGAMFKVLPDARIEWRQVWLAAVLTALFFVAGKSLVGLYLGNSSVTEAYGAAGSLAVILLWTYYSAMIFFFGAEFTRAWTEVRGDHVSPEQGAAKVVQYKAVLPSEDEPDRERQPDVMQHPQVK
jgi:membrane protein